MASISSGRPPAQRGQLTAPEAALGSRRAPILRKQGLIAAPMLFSSIVFLFYFLPVFFALYAAFRCKNIVLLAGSLLFYAWGEARYLWLLFLVGGIAWLGGRAIHDAQRCGRGYRAVLACTIAAQLTLLATFKYAAFLTAQLPVPLPASWRPLEHLALPLGISFFTFHAISYVMDVHRRTVARPATPLQLAVYLSMFPQLVAGPIVRYSTIAGDIAQRRVTLDDVCGGIRLFIVGLAQKVLLANTLAVPADAIFALPALDARTAWFGALCYTLQIYLDFAGYSLMAIGLARMMGLTLPANFRHPYASTSITEFWRRWHISLSTWFRDYLYIPLGGNRHGRARTVCNLWIVFLLCGLWHGAAWNFVLWGAWHGSFLALERTGLGSMLERLWRPLRHGYALLVVLLGWVLFRAADLSHAATMMNAMSGSGTARPGFGEYAPASVLAALAVGAAASVPWHGLHARLPATGPVARLASTATAAALAALLVVSAASLATGTYNPFIYFRF